jgi:hypothetical protein
MNRRSPVWSMRAVRTCREPGSNRPVQQPTVTPRSRCLMTADADACGNYGKRYIPYSFFDIAEFLQTPLQSLHQRDRTTEERFKGFSYRAPIVATTRRFVQTLQHALQKSAHVENAIWHKAISLRRAMHAHARCIGWSPPGDAIGVAKPSDFASVMDHESPYDVFLTSSGGMRALRQHQNAAGVSGPRNRAWVFELGV